MKTLTSARRIRVITATASMALTPTSASAEWDLRVHTVSSTSTIVRTALVSMEVLAWIKSWGMSACVRLDIRDLDAGTPSIRVSQIPASMVALALPQI